MVQRHLAHEKQPPPPHDHHRALGIVLLQGPGAVLFLTSEVPLNTSSWTDSLPGWQAPALIYLYIDIRIDRHRYIDTFYIYIDLCKDIYTYIYIYMNTEICICRYIYIYEHEPRHPDGRHQR